MGSSSSDGRRLAAAALPAAAPRTASATPSAGASPLPAASPSASPLPKTPSSGLGRLTLSSVNFCSASGGDAFCTDFFADTQLALADFPGGARLRAQALPLQGAFACALALGALTLARLAAVCCKAGARGGGLAGYCTPARLAAFSGLSAASCLGGALAGAWALRAYAAAAADFFDASGGALRVAPGGWALLGGWVCGAVAVGLLGAGALLHCAAAAGARRALRREAAEAAAAAAIAAVAGAGERSGSGGGAAQGDAGKGGGGGSGFFPPPFLYVPAVYVPPSAPDA